MIPTMTTVAATILSLVIMFPSYKRAVCCSIYTFCSVFGQLFVSKLFQSK